MAEEGGAQSLELDEVLDDLCIRFVVNLPEVEYESFERLFFAIESAHWFYDDFYRENNPSLPRLPLKQFAAKLFNHSSFLQQHRADVDRLTAQFKSYKQEVPTCGAVLLNPTLDKLVLVRGWGANAKWGFPKGKLSKGETELEAATREVFEETGFDMAPHVDDNTDFIDSMFGGKLCRIFIVPDIPEDTYFETRTRKEISAIDWVPVAFLPDSPKNAKLQNKAALDKDNPTADKSRKFIFAHYGVAPYTKRIRSWIKRRKTQPRMEGPSEPQLLGPISVEELEATLLPSNQPNSSELPQVATGHSVSVSDLEATLLPTNAPCSISEAVGSGDGKRKGNKNKPRGSPSKATARNSRRDSSRAETLRNQTTFGNSSGLKMDDVERNKLFRQYVVETDRIAAEKGLNDDCWPVPYITSKDFTEEEVRDAENARKRTMPEGLVRGLNTSSQPTVGMASSYGDTVKKKEPRLKVTETFAFDRAAILASMNAVGAS